MSIHDKVKLSESLELSRIVHGYWRLADWKMSENELLSFIQELIGLGITSFDHADIYGNFICEQLFGDAIKNKPSLREEMQLITKCGIRPANNKISGSKIKIYDYSFEHIISSVENSLKNFHTNRIDLLLFHRPAPFFNPEEVARAMNHLHLSGKVLNFGVSNFLPIQFEMLQAHAHQKLLTNQIEISPYSLEHFENGNMDFFVKEGIHPMAWSPLAGGSIFHPNDERGNRLLMELSAIADELETDDIDKVIYSWLLMHPSNIIPVAGSGKLSRLKSAVESLEMELSLEQWYRIYNASTGVELP